MEGALTDFVGQRYFDSTLMGNMDILAKSTDLMDVLTRQVVGSTSIITPVTRFTKRHVYRMVEEVHFNKALENQLHKPGIGQMLPCQSSFSQEIEPAVHNPPGQSSSSGSD